MTTTLFATGALLCATACGGSSGAGVIGGSDEVRLLEVQAQVFSPRCALSGCHIGIDAPFGLDLSAGNALGNTVGVSASEVPLLLRVDPGNAADSYLYMKLVDDPRIEGDPMPLLGAPLSASDLTLIETWIDQGAN
ncbi:MAG: hypothetical protein GY716_02935 [bacterium]|nr:hypothetical protein [bacterium]